MKRTKNKKRTIAIIGNGCSALWLARHAAGNGFECTVFGEEPIAAFSSTRNQGWLQSGAFYAGRADYQTALDCWTGFSDVAAYAPYAVRRETPCYFFFKDRGEAMQWRRRCASVGFTPLEMHVRQAIPIEPKLDDCQFPFLYQTLDCPIDTHALMNGLVRDCLHHGVQFKTLPLRETSVARDRNAWMVEVNNRRLGDVSYGAVVLACGAYIKRFCEGVSSLLADEFVPTKVGVLSVTGLSLNAFLLAKVEEGPYLVPFFAGGKHGFTVCLDGTDEEVQDIEHPTATSLPDHFEEKVFNAIRFAFPSIGRALLAAKKSTHVCQKIYRRGKATGTPKRSRIALDAQTVSEDLKGLFVLYPGKFTTAHLAARDCFALIVGSEETGVKVSVQPYG